MSMSNFMENNMLNYILKTPGGDTSFIRPSTPGLLFLAVFTDPSGLTASSLETNQGTGAVIPYEVSGNGYARTRVYFENPSFQGIISNSRAVEFPLATGTWGSITHYAILNIGVSDFPGTLFWGTFDTPQTIGTADRLVIRQGQLKVRMN
jgi:hypothetical protein